MKFGAINISNIILFNYRNISNQNSYKAIAILPRTFSCVMKPLYQGNRWRRVQYFHNKAKQLFMKPATDSILGGRRLPLSQTVQAILVLVLGPSKKSTLQQQIAADIRREQLGQLRASDVSQSEPEEWTAASALKPPTKGARHRPLQQKDFQAAAAA